MTMIKVIATYISSNNHLCIGTSHSKEDNDNFFFLKVINSDNKIKV